MKNRKQLQNELNDAFDTVIEFVRLQDRADFQKTLREESWSTGQQLLHLIKSVAPLNKGMKIPKILLKWRFGKTDRPEMSYEELAKTYKAKLDEGAISPAEYIPRIIQADQKEMLLARYEREKISLIKTLESWNEKQLSEQIAPHPILGMLTIREMMYFTIYHTYHHLASMKKISEGI
ncbi:MAG: DinB family protein [Balneola sp.]|nr:MAG: DinB family protein [Balneola sp.]